MPAVMNNATKNNKIVKKNVVGPSLPRLVYSSNPAPPNSPINPAIVSPCQKENNFICNDSQEEEFRNKDLVTFEGQPFHYLDPLHPDSAQKRCNLSTGPLPVEIASFFEDNFWDNDLPPGLDEEDLSIFG
eukprot:CAMPEP_0195510276 /NCGR_PEP_ID=MMETSP0794_2-20130614/2967_1 /TAXON_ID=515487 /ORGANISM="Stephanopyxis turris, Strain CCMP 815" /LENGTH=129 /DNA_ID=CAMNT_0040637661 /DNA_START=88 /DNA_END=477 /DNA_ORIENTATION=+